MKKLVFTTILLSTYTGANLLGAPPYLNTSEKTSIPSSKPTSVFDIKSKEKKVEEISPTTNVEQKQNLSTKDALIKEIRENYAYLDDLDLNINDLIPVEGDPDNYVVIYLEKKYILIRLYPELAPNTVEAFKKLIRDGFYNDTDFFRLIPNYILQGGDPTNSGYGGAGKLRNAEITEAKMIRGSVGMSNNGNLNSDDSQFFIVFDEFPWLEKKYTIFGQVISGMLYLDSLSGTLNNEGFLVDPIIINEIHVVSDLPKNRVFIKPSSSFSLRKSENQDKLEASQPSPPLSEAKTFSITSLFNRKK
jgi:peptidylprolyl isomerase